MNVRLNSPANDQALPLMSKLSLPTDLRALKSTFNDLPKDPYCADRTRRFSQFRGYFAKQAWQFERLAHRPHIQPPRFNQHTGGVLRHFEPLRIDAQATLSFAAETLKLDPLQNWHLDLHQWRIHCTSADKVPCVPEGRHKDGHQYVGIFVIDRHNIEGGETTVYQDDGKVLFNGTLQSGEGIVLNDRTVTHMTSAIYSAHANGYRDIFVVCVNPWHERKYGPAFETWCQIDRD